MRHKNTHRKFGREAQHRMAMLRNQVSSLIEHERIQTTDMKAKEVRRIAEKVITLGKKGDVHARRVAFKTVRSRDLVAKLFGPLADRFRTRPGGYTRIIKIGQRVGDAAPVSYLELIPGEGGAQQAPEEKIEKVAKVKKPKAEKAPKAAKPEGEAKPKAKKAKAEKAEGETQAKAKKATK
jgi:large subunit ribosomal protein L17